MSCWLRGTAGLCWGCRSKHREQPARNTMGLHAPPMSEQGGTHAALRFINKYCYYKIGQTQYQQLKRESALTQSSLLIPDFTVPAKAQLIYAKALIWQTPKAVVIVRVHENFIFLKPKLYLKTFCSTLGAPDSFLQHQRTNLPRACSDLFPS